MIIQPKRKNININKTFLSVKIILAILFLGCLLDWEYGYYQLVRFIGMVGFGFLAYNNYEKNKTWFLIWLSSIILINPIFKIALGRELWNIIDIVWVILLVTSIFIERNNKKHKTTKK
jgi:hypothetical protein